MIALGLKHVASVTGRIFSDAQHLNYNVNLFNCYLNLLKEVELFDRFCYTAELRFYGEVMCVVCGY
jgi:hypothetical protein